jgi:hypothetical protein
MISYPVIALLSQEIVGRALRADTWRVKRALPFLTTRVSGNLPHEIA